MLDLVSASRMGDKIFKLRGRELCEFVMKLCDRVRDDAGTSFRGGIFPGNIYEDEDGKLLIGPAAEFGWEGEELDYISPELYWNSARTPAADVYSIGLIMYAVFNDGKIPYAGECEDPILRRMNNDVIPAPESAGRRLGEIITKCLNFRAVERYQSMDELKAVISSCNTSLFLKDAPTAEAVLKKSDNELSAVERMMVDIIEKSDAEKNDAPTSKPVKDETPQEEVIVRKPSPVKRKGELPSAPANHVRVGMAGNSGVTPTIQYTSERLDRERKLAKEVKRRRRRPVIVILVLCALLVGAAFVFNRLTNDGNGVLDAEIEFTDESTTPIKIINPNTGEESTVIVEEPQPIVTPEPTPEPPREHRYELYVEDVSWTQARAKCEELGGHLVVINNAEELEQIINLATENGVNRVWIGCYRTNNNLVWVNGDRVTFYQWGKGEPSAYDYNDDIAEDYVMLWYLNGWVYNDQRNDLMKDYAAMYSGTIAYVCEYE